MDRDIDLARKILQKIKECKSPNGLKCIPKFNEYDDDIVSYHIKKLSEAKLITAKPKNELGTKYDEYFSINLTWDGHDFIDAAIDDTSWNKAKEKIMKAGGAFTFDILLEILKMKVKEKIGIP